MTRPPTAQLRPPSTVLLAMGCLFATLIFAAYVANATQGDCRLGRFGDLTGVGLLALALGYALGFTASKRRAGWWAIAILAAGAAAWPLVARRVGLVLASHDGFRATALVLVASLLGLGIYLGQCRARHGANVALGRRPWQILLLAPFGLIVVVSGAWLKTLAVISVVVLARAAGGAMCRRLLRDRARAVPAALEVAVGLGLLAPTVLMIGLAGWCSPTGLLVTWIVLTVLLWRPVMRYAADFVRGLAVDAPTSAATAVMRSALTAMFAVYFVAALGPELGWDATALRVAAPAHWLANGSISALPQLAATYGVAAGETLTLLMMPLAGSSATRLLAFAVALVLLRSLCDDVLSRPGAPASVLWFPFLTSSLVWWQMTAGMVDLLQMLHFYAAMLAVQAWLEADDHEPRAGWLALAGICAGSAAAIKWNGGIALIILAPILLVIAWRERSGRAQRGRRAWLRVGVPIAVAFGAVITPWVLRSFALTGNPVFPFANQLFASPLAPTQLIGVKLGIGTELTSWLRLPYSVFFEPKRFAEQGTLHPSLLAWLPLGLSGLWLASPEARRRAALWLGAGVLAFFTWGVTEQNARYGLFVAVFFAVAVGSGLHEWHQRLGAHGRCVLPGALVLSALGGFVFQRCPAGANYWDENCDGLFPAEVVLGTRSVEAHLDRHVETFGAGAWLAAHAQGPTKTWVLDPLRGDNLYLGGDVSRVYHGVTPRMAPLVAIMHPTALADRDEARRVLDRLGYTHLLDRVLPGEAISIPAAPHGPTSRDSWHRLLDPCFAQTGVRLFARRALPRSEDDLRDLYGPDQFMHPPEVDRTAVAEVQPGALYELEVELLSGPIDARLKVQLSFHAADAQRIDDWWQEVRGSSGAAGAEGFLHTAPKDATRADVSVTGDTNRFRLRWRRVHVDGKR